MSRQTNPASHTDSRARANGGGHSVGVPLRKHLQAFRVADLKDVYAFWVPDTQTNGLHKADYVEKLDELMSHEGVVYRRVRTLTRKVLDVLLLLLRRSGYASDLPGLFQRLPGEENFKLEYHEAEAGVKALRRRGFLAEVSDKRMASNGRVVYAVPDELGQMLTALFREETRTVASVFGLEDHAAAITAAERTNLREAFPALGVAPSETDVHAILGDAGAPGLLERLDEELRKVVLYAVERYGGVMLRTNWSARKSLRSIRWNRTQWAPALERAGVGTVARVSLKPYGIACDDEVLVVFREVLEDLLSRWDDREPEAEEILSPAGDVVADLCSLLEHIRSHPVKVGRNGEVHKSARRKIQQGLVFRESFLAGPQEIWAEIYGAADVLGLICKDKEGFLELTPQASRFLNLPLEGKTHELYHVALEQGGESGRSLHQHEVRNLVADCLREEPERWWSPRALASVARHRYLASLDERGIKDRHRDRYFSAYFSGTETPRDLKTATERQWLTRLHVLGILDVAATDERPLAWRLSPLGARVLGAERPGLDTGLQPVLVNPDFEIVVLPEGDVSDVIHTLDGFAQRTKSGEVAHFQITKASVETAVAAGRSVDEFLTFLEGRARGAIPQNVGFSIRRWAEGVAFATLERGIVLRLEDEAVLDRILAMPEMGRRVVRRLGPGEVLLTAEPLSRRLLSTLREDGIHVQGP